MDVITAKSELQQRVHAARRVRAAAGLAAIALLTVVSGCLYRFQLRDNPYGIQAVILMGLIGLVFLSLGRNARTRRMTELAILRFYAGFRFYGVVVSVSAALVFVYALTLKPSDKVHARETPAPTPAPAVVPAPEPVPAIPIAREFPELELSGVILNGARSSAIINQKYVEVGETIEGVRLVEIGENGIVVELDGRTKRISRFAQPPSATAGREPAK
jgi:hypothetical protein